MGFRRKMKKLISLVLGLGMVMGLHVPFIAGGSSEMRVNNNWQTIATAPSGIASWYIDEANVLWGTGGWSSGQHVLLGDGLAQRRASYVRIMENVAYIAFVSDGRTT
jgi:hypothetical protein